MTHDFLSPLTGSFAMPAAENPTVAMIEAAYRHHGLNWRYINVEVAPEAQVWTYGDPVRVPAEQEIHLFLRKRAGQWRGPGLMHRGCEMAAPPPRQMRGSHRGTSKSPTPWQRSKPR